MAVYTVLDRADVETFIKPFGIGPLIDFQGVAEGIENTNYFITTDQSDLPSETQTQPEGHFVLTIFEAIPAAELGFYIDLTSLLNVKGLPVPCPLKNADGQALQMLQDKPALLLPRISGSHPDTPSVEQCQAVARTLAGIHAVCLQSTLNHESGRNLDWLHRIATQLTPRLSADDQSLLEELPRFQQQTLHHPDLPRHIIHSDLFRDNVLFKGDELTAIIDFNSAGNGYLLFDLAVVVNDWCSTADGSLDLPLAQATLAAYQQVRPLTNDEKSLWNDFLRIAASRFWLSRLEVQLKLESHHRSSGLVDHKDPQQYKTILLHRINHPMVASDCP